MDAMLQAALAYREDGLSPLALCPPSCDCGAPGKVPHTKNWQAACAELPDEESLIDDFARLGGNVGIAAGLASGVIIVDCDAEEAYQYLMRTYDIPPTTPVVRSGRIDGGAHVYFQHDPSVDTSDVEVNGHAYEIKSNGSQCVAPPSIHKSGNTYRWVVPFDRDHLIPLPPAFLEDAKAPAKKVVKAASEALASRKNRDTATELFNDTADYRALLGNHGWCATGETSEDPKHGTLEYWTRPGKEEGISAVWHVDGRFLYVFTSNAPHLSKDRYYFLFDLFAIYEHGGDRTKAAKALNPTPPPPPPDPPPATHTPPITASDTETHADEERIDYEAHTPTDTQLNSDTIIPRGSWLDKYLKFIYPTTDAPDQFGLACGLSVLSMACRNAFVPYGQTKIRPNLWIALIAPSSLYRKSTSISAARSLLDDWESGLVFPNQMSPEAFVKQMAQDKAYGLFVWSEISSQLEAFDNRSYMRGYKSDLTDLYDCPPNWHRRTNADGLITVENPFINIMTASTQEWLNACLSDGNLKGGFLPRFLWVLAHKKTRFLAWPESPDPMIRTDLLQGLDNVYRIFQGGLTVDSSAKDLYAEYVERLEAQSAAALEFEGVLGAFYSRLATYVLKFAILYQCDLQASLYPSSSHRIVTPEAMEYAIALGDYLKSGISLLLDKIAFNEDMQDRQKVIAIIRAAPGIVRSRLMRTSRLSRKRLDEVLETLFASELATFKKETGNGRPTLSYYPLKEA